jgi:hypothetical protein
MEKERFIERMLETENLTDELEDRDANWLLDWGIGMLDQALEGIAGDEAAGGKVNALMAVMRKINRITGNRENRDTQNLAADLLTLTGLFEAAFGAARPVTAAECAAAAAQLPALPSRQSLELLTAWGIRSDDAI